jgi:hypothetical protein
MRAFVPFGENAMTLRAASVLALLFALVGTPAVAQTARAAIAPSFAGDCAVVVTLAGERTGDIVQVQVAFGSLQSRPLESDGLKEVSVGTGAPLQKGDTLRLLVNGSEIAGARITTADASSRPPGRKALGECAKPETEAFAGDSLEASAYFGWAFDQFAPDSLGGYPPNTLTERHNRVLFGVNFDYRMTGSDHSRMQLWLTGETMHGVRSADVDCTAEENKPVECNPAPGVSYARAVLADSTSVEAYVAPRLLFAQLQKAATTPTRLYATARFGFIALAGAPRVYKNHHLGLGLMADDGPFAGSRVEFGWGMNELLSGRSWKRFKVDGLVTFPVPKMGDTAHFFIQMFIDNDLKGNTPDSIQSFMGIDLDIRRFFGGS